VASTLPNLPQDKEVCAMIRMFNQDCMEAMKELPDKAYDLAIVDPPYGIGEDGHRRTRLKHHYGVIHAPKAWDSAPPKQAYFDELFRVSNNQVIWGANYFTYSLFPSMGWIFWDKQIGGDFSDGELAFTSFSRALQKFTFWNGNNGIPRIHPAQKPVCLYEWLLKNYAKPGDTILDTHMGSGSSAIACDILGYDFTGYEIDAEYFTAAKERLERHQRQGVLEL
jgi:site-specific DNA-methyltransferase (adenine-specific)